MFTVGFGDLAPTNTNEALFLIFIQAFSCIVLAYNINCIGNIISHIRSYEIEKCRDLKVLKQISEESHISPQLKNQINDYICESANIKKNYNIEEESRFIKSLP